ncbi:MAG: aminotransferase class V-fold PLP-dependent enzyme [Chitinophagia bacterium]|jgi:selenocysteine lyase/cysteine desulfurase|nr:aminotransferase class V-fold PLP-dependent enzyme [Chitinophagia bacterium]NCA29462.1 aminotransferase class V-fold PLP-dependent enzyme [Chitinophagia bacterium]NDD15639.1 aminotransferase class V-fold PLP-dependent enzyme [Chitinophagia bacterium]
MNKRQFIKDIVLTSIATPLGIAGMAKSFEQKAHLPATILAKDEDFWTGIRNQYLLKPDYINLENGYYNFLPQPILNKFIEHIKEVNYQGSYYMRTVQFENKKNIAARLAGIAGCLPEELVITRNTTESLDLVIGGFDWKAGDEAIMAVQDYGAMLDMFDQIHNRYGVVNIKLSVPNHPKNDEEIVNLYASAITPKTKVIFVSHMINITGQVLPIRKICDMAHTKGVQVIVDGAHAFAHVKFRIDELDCDYYAAALHKWLSTPLGAGLLYVKKNNVKNLWPLLADGEKDINKINRLNHIGTHPVHTDLTINDCMDYYEMIGAERKEARMYFLQNYWTSKVRNLPKIIINTPAEANRSCGIANVGIEGILPADLAKRLMTEHKIFTVAIDYANVRGCRITPNLYTTTQELDSFVLALKTLAKA